MRRLLFSSVILLAAACSGSPPATEGASSLADASDSLAGEPVSVDRVLDGDSLTVVRTDGSTTELRLIGINAPEGDECHGDQARAALRDLVAAEQLQLVAHADEADQFGRLLAYLYADGANVNQSLVATGHALVLQTGHTLEEDFIAAAEAAARAQIGMWSPQACGSDSPVPEIDIDAFTFDPPGRDSANANAEVIVLRNNDSSEVTMSSWILRDESAQHRYVFPPGFALAPGDRVTVHSGCGDASRTDLYWCASDPVWSNGGDTIILQIPDGTIVAWKRYAGDF